ncbi:hypothetical protein DB32_002181 [Sandaracinus amylolyticus]|uniref:Uncharacterized protein n=1 Tax=Sandaracinus amylolyticus TaxID=927083 RepID=A0A0F6YGS8_9BACT|nr:hypothetical protein DB32_002181 [Sandaracinus amylolyticus]
MRGIDAESSAKQSAPASATAAPSAHTSSAASIEPACCTTSAGFLKMPVPIVALITIAAAASVPISRRREDSPAIPSAAYRERAAS